MENEQQGALTIPATETVVAMFTTEAATTHTEPVGRAYVLVTVCLLVCVAICCARAIGQFWFSQSTKQDKATVARDHTDC
ncbi:hypothetical protein QBC32DRAFT_314510 [Pseudoneurospora amorphoporcata]|uniref:Uncharacterized protein n=1 Tax=Pseudoneurospora amorphoporcata TaxID=241081 RepID=A0AAN6NVH7_9PEZI|nr:hypothetical protein QBC32DRAFT_314510 [Pseudoneurospora amorphoporcata]